LKIRSKLRDLSQRRNIQTIITSNKLIPVKAQNSFKEHYPELNFSSDRQSLKINTEKLNNEDLKDSYMI